MAHPGSALPESSPDWPLLEMQNYFSEKGLVADLSKSPEPGWVGGEPFLWDQL